MAFYLRMANMMNWKNFDLSSQFRCVTFAAITLLAVSACEEPQRGRLLIPPNPTTMGTSQDAAVTPPGADSGVTPPVLDAGTTQTPADTGATMPPVAPGTLVRGLDISEAAIYQGVKISLVEDGREVSRRNAPVVQNREALLRFFVRPQAEWTSRLIRARLELRGSGFGVHEMTKDKQLSNASSDSFLGSSINFEIPGSYMVSDLTWSIALEETESVMAGGDSDLARYPQSGQTRMSAESAGEKLKIVLVPIQYNHDGTGRLPSTTADQINRYREGLYALFPTPEVEITVREPMVWSREVQPFGQGWSELLQAILNLRRSERAARNVYYYGAVSPSDSMASFCNRGCVAGLSTLSSDPGNDYVRGSIGLGFAGDKAVGTLVHEVGHAHGRRHAPCGLSPNQESDPGYPYSGGVLGVWGYDLNRKILIDPNEYKDLMSYCDPRWISDYQYKELFDRISYVNQLAFRIPSSGSSGEWTSVIIGMDGTPRWGTDIDSDAAFGGELAQVNFLNDSGQLHSIEDARYFPFSHIPGGLLLLPKPADSVSSIRLPNGFELSRP